MSIHQLLPGTNKYGQLLTLKIGLTSDGTFERVRQLRMRQQLPGDSLRIHTVAFASARTTPTTVGCRLAHTSRTSTPAASKATVSRRPSPVLPSIAQTAPGDCLAAHAINGGELPEARSTSAGDLY